VHNMICMYSSKIHPSTLIMDSALASQQTHVFDFGTPSSH
jgi:hypothetical protein